ncbi:hypothetical protein O3P69_004307 [Scylla paramamosain]|uniref:Uncharacterized protein n=1 Tax=Scylla paramamosain TaxID=85552 RepID=A0AAW0UHH6_SCYPA
MKQAWRLAKLWTLQLVVVSATMTLHTPSASDSVVSAQRLAVPSTHTIRVPFTKLDSDLDQWGMSLRAALQTLVAWELSQCSLVVAADSDYLASQTLDALTGLPNQKQVNKKLWQVVGVTGGWEAAGRRVVWRARGCRAYIFLLRKPQALLSFGDSVPALWDYGGRYVLVGLTRDELDALTLTHKGRKTEHLVGLVQSDKVGKWEVYINQLYWGPGMRLHATWRKGHFSSPASPFIDKISDIRGSVLQLFILTVQIAMFEWEPSTLYRRNEEGVLEHLYGRDIEVIRALADVFNFTAKFIETYDGVPLLYCVMDVFRNQHVSLSI